MSDIKASPKAEAWILRTGHGTTVVEHKPPCEIDLWQPLYTAALREQLKDCSAAFDRLFIGYIADDVCTSFDDDQIDAAKEEGK
jgi:hypothetical protein